MKKVLINNRWKILLPDFRDNPESWKEWEKERLAAIYEVIRPFVFPDHYFQTKDQIVFDIGAEQGDFTGLFAMWGAKVVAFEPNPKIWRNIKAIFDANKLKLTGHFVGFASNVIDIKPDKIEAVINEPDKDGWPACAYGEVTEENEFRGVHERTHDTPSITIDHFVEVNKLVPTILNIDVEGAEYLVLEGAAKTLTDNKVDVFVSIHPEMMFHIHQKYTTELIGLMGSFGYGWKYLAFDHEFHFHFFKV